MNGYIYINQKQMFNCMFCNSMLTSLPGKSSLNKLFNSNLRLVYGKEASFNNDWSLNCLKTQSKRQQSINQHQKARGANDNVDQGGQEGISSHTDTAHSSLLLTLKAP